MIENLLEGDQLRTNVDGIESSIEELRPENIVCVLTTTSCFAPRAIDKWVQCSECGMPMLVVQVDPLWCMHTYVVQWSNRHLEVRDSQVFGLTKTHITMCLDQ